MCPKTKEEREYRDLKLKKARLLKQGKQLNEDEINRLYNLNLIFGGKKCHQ